MLTGYKMNKRVGAIEEFQFEPIVFGNSLRAQSMDTQQLHITIAITGWLSNQMKGICFLISLMLTIKNIIYILICM